jgi:hypothetical protein
MISRFIILVTQDAMSGSRSATNQVCQVNTHLFNITMPVPHSEGSAYLASHAGVLGKGWTEVDTLEGLDPDEYELEEEVGTL